MAPGRVCRWSLIITVATYTSTSRTRATLHVGYRSARVLVERLMACSSQHLADQLDLNRGPSEQRCIESDAPSLRFVVRVCAKSAGLVCADRVCAEPRRRRSGRQHCRSCTRPEARGRLSTLGRLVPRPTWNCLGHPNQGCGTAAAAGRRARSARFWG